MTPQEQFKQRYVTSVEICAELGISRNALFKHRRKGGMPDAIELCDCKGGIIVAMWDRELVQPHLDAYRAQVAARKDRAA